MTRYSWTISYSSELLLLNFMVLVVNRQGLLFYLYLHPCIPSQSFCKSFVILTGYQALEVHTRKAGKVYSMNSDSTASLLAMYNILISNSSAFALIRRLHHENRFGEHPLCLSAVSCVADVPCFHQPSEPDLTYTVIADQIPCTGNIRFAPHTVTLSIIPHGCISFLPTIFGHQVI